MHAHEWQSNHVSCAGGITTPSAALNTALQDKTIGQVGSSPLSLGIATRTSPPTELRHCGPKGLKQGKPRPSPVSLRSAPPGSACHKHASDRGLRGHKLVVAGGHAVEDVVQGRGAHRAAQLGELLPHVVENLPAQGSQSTPQAIKLCVHSACNKYCVILGTAADGVMIQPTATKIVAGVPNLLQLFIVWQYCISKKRGNSVWSSALVLQRRDYC